LESGTASSPSFESADIIVGTQSVLPLLNDPKITLACALIADIGMSQPDFRASERAAQRLSMLLHRGSQIKREVIIQTFRPDAPEILTLAKDSPMEFLDHELRLRKELDYPPFSTMIALLCRGGQAEASAEMLKSSLKGIHIQKAVLPKKDVRLLLRGHDLQQSLVSLDLKDVSIDVDPVEL
jgi:primosomal protein N' (replication factor Y)